jgi:ADP-heptose:LPS heptosyltransferase
MTKKILIVRFSSIGDIVLTTPVIRALKTQYNGGDVELHYLTKSAFEAVLSANPYLDQLYTIQRDVAEISGKLRRQQYDHVIDLHNNLRSLQLKMALRRPTRTLDKLDLRRLLYIRCKINLLPNKHVVDRYLEVVRPLGVVNDKRGLDYFLRPQDYVDPDSLPAVHREGYIAIVIGGKHSGKLYPVQQLIQLCRLLQAPVILLGSAEDRQRGDTIAAQAGQQVFNACGLFSLNQAAALVRDAQCVISNDTGLMHIATAFKKQIISLWGATVPQFGMYPYLPGTGSQILEAQSRERPYSKHGGKALFKSPYDCWSGLEPEKIYQAVQGNVQPSAAFS